MSGPIYDVGSIINFWPIASSDETAGVALVVTKQENSVIHTELRRVAYRDGAYIVLSAANDGKPDWRRE